MLFDHLFFTRAARGNVTCLTFDTSNMKTLLDIAEVIASRGNGRRLAVTEPQDGTDTLFSSFIKGLLDHRYATDDEAASELYGTNHQDQRYRTLKSRAFDRLLHVLLLLDFRRPTYSEYIAQYHRCARNVVAVRLLMSFASRKIGTRIAEKTLIVTKRYQFTELTLDLLILLRASYSIYLDRRSFQECNEQIREHLALFKAELRSDEILHHLQINTRQGEGLDVSTRRAAQTWLTEHAEITQLKDSNKLRLNQHLIAIVHHGLEGNVREFCEACDDARRFYDETPALADPVRVGSLSLIKLRACLTGRQIGLVAHEISNIVKEFTEGSPEWFKALEYGTMAYIHSGDYNSAFQLWVRGRMHSVYSHMPTHVMEPWRLLEAYVHLLVQLDLITPKQGGNLQFDTTSFLRAVPEFSMEHARYNSHILILHVCFHLMHGDYKSADARLEHLRVYASRYIKSSHDQVLRVFIKHLVGLSKAKYKVSRVTVSTESITEQLHASVPANGLAEPNEIVPFSVLFHQLSSILARR